ncbi:MAG: cysteine desulfurase family protein [Candidatus Taylorbacteria bacterium]|nr:cysteine desulfurase family protein [Candidatus Taylorbacteria bacterium]
MSRVVKKLIYPHTHFRYKPKALRLKKSKVSVGVYLDNAAATPVNPEVKKEMAQVMELYGNPSSFNDVGRLARKKLDESRVKVARFIGARPEEVVFTSSGSEANNLAIQGIARNFQFSIFNFQKKFKYQKSKPHVITTPIEHPSVLEPMKQLEKTGFDITYLSVDREGFVNLDELKKNLRPTTVLVSIIYANNEIGTIQPIAKISKIIRNFRSTKSEIRNPKQSPKILNSKSETVWNFENSNLEFVSNFDIRISDLTAYPLFHVDSCQATGYLDMNVNNLGIDLLTFNGSKIYGPRGIGALYVRRGVNLRPLILGGGQEHGLRAGTENLAAIAGLAKAVALIDKKEGERVSELRDYFFTQIQKAIPGIKINGPLGQNRLPNNINISVANLDSENLLLELGKYGIYASSGSACTARSVEPSHVLKAIGVEKKYLNGALRFSLGRQTTKKDIDYVLEVLPKIVGDLRKRYKWRA